MTSQPSVPEADASGAPAVEGQAAGAGLLAPDHIAKRLEQVEALQRKLEELQRRYEEAKERLGIDEDKYPVDVPSMFDYVPARLLYVMAYYFGTSIQQRIKAGQMLNDDEWISVRERLDKLYKDVIDNETFSRLFDVAKEKLLATYEELLRGSITLEQIRKEIDEINKVLDEMVQEIFAIEQ